MSKRQRILGFKPTQQFSLEERRNIIEEYLQTNCTKQEIWEKYTGQSQEHGTLLCWMRKLGYINSTKSSRFVDKKSIYMAKNKQENSFENEELKEKIKQLEQALLNSELRATALDTMIEIAERELKINIRKKSSTKQSTK